MKDRKVHFMRVYIFVCIYACMNVYVHVFALMCNVGLLYCCPPRPDPLGHYMVRLGITRLPVFCHTNHDVTLRALVLSLQLDVCKVVRISALPKTFAG